MSLAAKILGLMGGLTKGVVPAAGIVAPNDTTKYLRGGLTAAFAGLAGTASIGADASIPAAGNAGNVYYPNDWCQFYVDDGVTWNPIFPPYGFCTVASGFNTWRNQTTGSTDTLIKTGTRQLYMPTPTGGGQFTGREKAVPGATPYGIQGLVDCQVVRNTIVPQSPIAGLYMTDGTKSMLWGQNPDGSGDLELYLDYQSTNTANPTGVLAAKYTAGAPRVWLKVINDGTNLVFYVSHDGQTWIQVYTEVKTTHLGAITAYGWGRYLFADNTSYMNCYSLKEVTS